MGTVHATSSQIVVSGLCKMYRVPEREAGLRSAIRSLVHRRYRDVLAVDNISFTVQPGEVVGFIGPNGAGKTTTLKMLSGLLYPTGGKACVEGYVPWERKSSFLRTISMVMGNRSQLRFENTVMDSLLILKEIYRLPADAYRHSLDELVALLEIESFLPQMVRNLSLGERMRCELAAALLHRPRVLFLDEPTLGLDVSMQFRLRHFVADYNRRNEATTILTSHYMADVVALCPRVILIHQGRLLFDGELAGLAERMAPFKLIRIAVEDDPSAQSVAGVLADLGRPVTVVEQNGRQCTLRVNRADTAGITARLLNNLLLADLTVEDPPIEAVIDQLYREGLSS